MRNLHKKCPINNRKYIDTGICFNDQSIIDCINQAKKLKFSGYIGFHYYNEPLLELDKILNIIKQTPSTKFLLWTNGLLLDRKIENNQFLSEFDAVVVSCYREQDKEFFNRLAAVYPHLTVNNFELDHRLDVYHQAPKYVLGCKRPLFEIPIDYYGNVHLCCIDWNNTCIIGNVLRHSLIDILQGQRYQAILEQAKKTFLSEDSPMICRRCFKRLVRYDKADYFGKGIKR